MPQLVGYHDGDPIIPPKCAPCQALKWLRPQVHAYRTVVCAVSRDTMATGRGGRPSESERWKKINAARKLIEAEDWKVVDPGKLDDDLRELEDEFGTEWATDEDKVVLLREALSEIRAEHYSEDQRQPEIAKNITTAGLKMWKFKWQSNKDCFGKGMMWMKFSVIGTGDNGPLWIYSLHIDHPPSEQE
jgi:hypothetical protein